MLAASAAWAAGVLASPGKSAARGVGPGVPEGTIDARPTPRASVVAETDCVPRVKVRERPASGVPLPSVRRAARAKGSLYSPSVAPSQVRAGACGPGDAAAG